MAQPFNVLGVFLLWLGLVAPSSGGQQPAKEPPRFHLRWTAARPGLKNIRVEVLGLTSKELNEVRNLDWSIDQWPRLLSVYADPPGNRQESTWPAMLGDYSVQAGALRFDSRFPAEPGMTYRAVFHPEQLPATTASQDQAIVSRFQTPAPSARPSTVLRQVYPSAEVLPENLLKFYLHFSAPMSGGRVYDHIHLRHQDGKEIELPFLEIDEELWDPTMTRLTLFIDPGRIKRGVRPLEEIGPVLEAGKQFRLVVDRDWKDAAGIPLKRSFQKTFRAGPPDRDPPDPLEWRIRPPRAGTRQALEVSFPEPMDHALALRLIRVVTDTGKGVEGRTELADAERRWVFRPAGVWPIGRYRLLTETRIEDLAGNNIGKAFEVDVLEPIERHLTTATRELLFEVR